ncbi:FtsQ-type POTRA domain-containing protein [Pediococcus acidilactici]|nr:FtsQ-type POTRA domain-containing protein [Pediococcus acidilactici]
MPMKKRKDDENLTPWARYQKEHQQLNRAKKRSKGGKFKNPLRKNSPGNQRKQPPKKKVHHPFRISKPVKIVLASFIGGLILLTVYLCTPVSRVQSITVQGNKRVDSSQVIKKTAIKKNDVIPVAWFTEHKDEAQLVHEFPDLKDVQISVSLLGHVKVKVRENAVMGYVVRNKYYYAVRQDGTVSKKSATQPDGDYPVFRQFKDNQILKRFLSEYAKLPNEVQNDVAEVDYTATKKERHQLHFFMNDGNEVYAVLNTFAKKMKYYPEISASMKKRGIVDLQVGAYSYPRSQADTSTSSSATAEVEDDKSQSTTHEKSSSIKAQLSKSSSASSSSSNSVSDVDYQTQQRRATQNSVTDISSTDDENADVN